MLNSSDLIIKKGNIIMKIISSFIQSFTRYWCRIFKFTISLIWILSENIKKKILPNLNHVMQWSNLRKKVSNTNKYSRSLIIIWIEISKKEIDQKISNLINHRLVEKNFQQSSGKNSGKPNFFRRVVFAAFLSLEHGVTFETRVFS